MSQPEIILRGSSRAKSNLKYTCYKIYINFNFLKIETCYKIYINFDFLKKLKLETKNNETQILWFYY